MPKILATKTSVEKTLADAGIYDMAELADSTPISEEMLEQVQSFMKGADLEKVKAKYKLEVVFTEERSAFKTYRGMVFAWTNGGFAHGGGDEAVYFCTARTENNGVTTTCGAPINLQFVSKKAAICPTCKRAFSPQSLAGQFFARLPTQHWATLITRTFRALECNADIRIGLSRSDLRQASAIEQEKEKRGDLLNKVRNEREWIIYPLESIIRDTSNGSDLYGRIKAFLTA